MKCNYFIPDSFSFFMSDITIYNYFVMFIVFNQEVYK